MECLNSISIDTSWGERTFELWHGDITNLDFAIDLLMISTVGSDYSPMSGTVVGALLSQLGISVEQLSKDPELEIIFPSGGLWVSKVVTPNRIGRIMCVEIPLGGSGADQIVQQAFRSLPMLEARGLPLNSICLPVLGTGLARLNVEDLLRPILDGAQWALRILKSLDHVHFVEISAHTASRMSDAMDSVLGRVKIILAKGALVEAIQKEIQYQLEKLEVIDLEARRVVERIRKAISVGSRSLDVGMAGRLLREYVVAKVLAPEDIKKMTPFEVMQSLRKKRVAEWIISYLNLLHAFGNETAHHQTQNTHPPEIDEDDLAACLFGIQRVLDFWFSWQALK
jgi:hypothetical protein